MKPTLHSAGMILATLALAGCATPYRPPADVAHLELRHTDSPSVHVEKLWLDRQDGALALHGFVVGLRAAPVAQAAHLDVRIFDAAGTLLREALVPVAPEPAPADPRLHRDTRYRVGLDPLPVGAARIEVRAHDEPHG